MSAATCTLDGNGVAGLLSELLAVEVTTVLRTCQSCGDRRPMGEHRAYHGAGGRPALPELRRRRAAHRLASGAAQGAAPGTFDVTPRA